MVTLNFFYKFMHLSEERMQQRIHEKLNEQKDAMEQNITMNVIARLQRQNPDLRLDLDMLRFSARSSVEASSAQQVVVQVNSQLPNVIHLLLFLLLLLFPWLGFCFCSRQSGYGGVDQEIDDEDNEELDLT
ncbi:uncharacterized protein LOC107795587 isoform X1 [Nicotiana tabacum]|uniref:Uncharacterized protein LOC107795587 isoform X1 n=2 Tax=Nicotiana TaxID=4085 RepID=A0A1S4AAS1_TOBAC|nr:PREDICTED: uncharacterized protein LOC104236626 isoform X1 [Nicotiana sylvestris]XP_016473742.1 PREDICTED: uncharacterized protein LOC107795587 isoform X1 [Nicotiana tabacum]